VTVAVVDDGLEYDHPDLQQNFCADCSYDFNRNKDLPTPGSGDDHGTSAAGVAAAGNNTACGVGVAYLAQLAGLRLISDPVTDATEARGLSHRTDLNHVFSCSWGPTDDGRRLEGPGPLTQLAMLDAVTTGREGKGTVFVWAGGNGRRSKDNCNYDGYANSRLTIAVGAVDSTGA
jgi:kexin